MISNMLSRKRFKRGLAVAALFLCMLFAAIPVYAEPEDEAVTTEAVAETETQAETAKPAEEETTAAKKQEETKEKETKKEDAAEKSEPDKALTPVGNLTLIDDVISAVDGNKEFLTFVSKSGNYFYLVIDRDAEGTGNVYFLNLVDENDLYALTGEKASSVSSLPAVEEEPVISYEVQTKETDAEEETTPLTEEEIAQNKKKSLMITVGVLAAIGVGVVIFALNSKKKKKSRADEFDISDFDDDDE